MEIARLLYRVKYVISTYSPRIQYVITTYSPRNHYVNTTYSHRKKRGILVGGRVKKGKKEEILRKLLTRRERCVIFDRVI